MKRTKLIAVVFLMLFIYGLVPPAGAKTIAISGRLEGGLRILTIPAADIPLEFTVYRGDYVKFEWQTPGQEMVLVIPALDIEQRLPRRLEDAAHIAMRRSGVFDFTLNARPGTIKVVDFKRPNYRELTAVQAADMIARFAPLILDVRTPREFQAGHLPDAVLIPVQVLQANISRLASYRAREILVYCATGNRSTVASKILIDGGFKQIANLRHGIVDWQSRNLPVVR